MKIKRGEIYMTGLPNIGGSIQSGYRPVLIVQNNIGNKYSPTTIVVPITTKKEQKQYLPTHVRANKQPGLRHNSTILCEQIMTVNQDSLDMQIGKLNRKKLFEVNVALAVSVVPGLVTVACQIYKVRNRMIVEKSKVS
jgi:mRNA interferase MazF